MKRLPFVLGLTLVATLMYPIGCLATVSADGHTITGKVQKFDGKYKLVVDGSSILLSQTTVIVPSNGKIAVGETVEVMGAKYNGVFYGNVVTIKK